MQIATLVRLLKEMPQDQEVRVSACIEHPDFDERPSWDLAIAGLSTAFTPAGHVPLDFPKEHEVVWIVTSLKLSQPSKKS